MSEYHLPFEEAQYANGSNDSADQGGTYHKGAIFVMDLTNSASDAFDVVVKLQAKATPDGTTYVDWTATPTLFTVDETDAATVKTFVVAPSASADLNAFMPRLWRVNAAVTSAGPVSEVQLLDLGDIGTGDTFKIQTGGTGTKTVNISYSTVGTGTAMATAMTNALNTIFGAGMVTVAKVSQTTFTVTFDDTLGSQTLLKVTDTATFTPKGDEGYVLGFLLDTAGVAEPTFEISAQMLN